MIGKIKDIGLWITVYGHAPHQKTVEELFFCGKQETVEPVTHPLVHL